MEFPSDKLHRVIHEVWESKHSDFYRNLWEKTGLSEIPTTLSEESWQSIPFMSRIDLTAVPDPTGRLFMELKDVEMLRNTSGTTGLGPLYLWRDSFRHENYEWDKKRGAKRSMVFFTYHFFMSAALPTQIAGFEALCGDPHNIPRSVKMLVAGKVNALLITPSLALVLIDYLKEKKYLEKIDLLTLWGEYCSEATYKVLKKAFKKAKFNFQYGTAESNDVIAFATDECDNPWRVKHLRPDFFYTEIIHEEIILTSLRLPQALPIVRYKTGDAGCFITKPCSCGSLDPRIEFLGRIGSDFVRISGGELRVEEVERVMSPFYTFIDPIFKIEIEEQYEGERRIANMTVFIKKKENCTLADEALTNQISRALVEKVRLSSTMNLSNAIAGNLCSSPRVIFVSKFDSSNKNPRLIFKNS